MTHEAHVSGRTKERNAEQKSYKDRFHVGEGGKTKPDILLTMPMDQLKYLILLLGRNG